MIARILGSADEITKRIAEQRGLAQADVRQRIKAKQDEYCGLLTEAGAAYSVAKELGVDSGFEEAVTTAQKLADIKERTDSLSFSARVVSVLPPKSFTKGDRTGKFASAQVDDGTAVRRLVLWDDKADLATRIKPGDTIRVAAAYSRQNRGEMELHLGMKGSMEIIAGKDAQQAQIKPQAKLPDIVKISDLGKEDKGRSIRATIVDVFPPTMIEVCAKCGGMVRQGKCEKCGSSEARLTYIVNAELDDGSGVIRAAFYRQRAEALLGVAGEELKKQADLFRMKKKTIIGEERIFSGDARYVPEFDRMEFIVRNFSDIDVLGEIERLNR